MRWKQNMMEGRKIMRNTEENKFIGHLKTWDGRHGGYQYDLEQVADWNMQISDDGTVWYLTHEEQPKLMIWCPASRLGTHLYRLTYKNSL